MLILRYSQYEFGGENIGKNFSSEIYQRSFRYTQRCELPWTTTQVLP